MPEFLSLCKGVFPQFLRIGVGHAEQADFVGHSFVFEYVLLVFGLDFRYALLEIMHPLGECAFLPFGAELSGLGIGIHLLLFLRFEPEGIDLFLQPQTVGLEAGFVPPLHHALEFFEIVADRGIE